MRWVSVNERLPEKGDLYWTKIRLKDSNENWFPDANNFYDEWEISDDYEVLEWLDESPSEGENVLLEALEKIKELTDDATMDGVKIKVWNIAKETIANFKQLKQQ